MPYLASKEQVIRGLFLLQVLLLMLESANKIFHRFPRAKIRLIPFFELGELLLQLFNVLFLRLLALLHSLLERAQIVPQQCILNRQLGSHKSRKK